MVGTSRFKLGIKPKQVQPNGVVSGSFDSKTHARGYIVAAFVVAAIVAGVLIWQIPKNKNIAEVKDKGSSVSSDASKAPPVNTKEFTVPESTPLTKDEQQNIDTYKRTITDNPDVVGLTSTGQ